MLSIVVVKVLGIKKKLAQKLYIEDLKSQAMVLKQAILVYEEDNVQLPQEDNIWRNKDAY